MAEKKTSVNENRLAPMKKSAPRGKALLISLIPAVIGLFFLASPAGAAGSAEKAGPLPKSIVPGAMWSAPITRWAGSGPRRPSR